MSSRVIKLSFNGAGALQRSHVINIEKQLHQSHPEPPQKTPERSFLGVGEAFLQLLAAESGLGPLQRPVGGVSVHEGGGVVQVSGQGGAVGEQGPRGGCREIGAQPRPLPFVAASAFVGRGGDLSQGPQFGFGGRVWSLGGVFRRRPGGLQGRGPRWGPCRGGAGQRPGPGLRVGEASLGVAAAVVPEHQHTGGGAAGGCGGREVEVRHTHTHDPGTMKDPRLSVSTKIILI